LLKISEINGSIMKRLTKNITIFIVLLAGFLSACSGDIIPAPNLTPTPTLAPVSSPSPIPSGSVNTDTNTQGPAPSEPVSIESSEPATTTGESDSTEPNSLDPLPSETVNAEPNTLLAAYMAYYDLIESLIDDYGVGYNQGNVDFLWDSKLWWTAVYSGVIYAELIDFNNDGLPELLVMYNDGNTWFSDTWAIYGYTGTVERYFKMLYGFEGGSGNDAEIALSSNGMKYLIYCHYYYVYDDERDYCYYTVKDDSWVKALTRSVSITDESKQWGYQGEFQWEWFVNGCQVSEIEYDTAPEIELEIINIRNFPFYTRYQEDFEIKNERASGFVNTFLVELNNRIAQLETLIEDTTIEIPDPNAEKYRAIIDILRVK